VLPFSGGIIRRTIKDSFFSLSEPIRFLVAGIANTVFGYLLFAFGLLLLSGPLQSLGGFVANNYYVYIQWFMWALSVPFGAFTLKYFVFRSKGPYLRQALRSYGVYLPAQLLATVLLIVFTSWFARLLEGVSTITVAGRTVDPIVLIAQFATVLFTMIVSYLGHKHFTFKSVGRDFE
jgi:putative flippase GtrA